MVIAHARGVIAVIPGADSARGISEKHKALSCYFSADKLGENFTNASMPEQGIILHSLRVPSSLSTQRARKKCLGHLPKQVLRVLETVRFQVGFRGTSESSATFELSSLNGSNLGSFFNA